MPIKLVLDLYTAIIAVYPRDIADIIFAYTLDLLKQEGRMIANGWSYYADPSTDDYWAYLSSKRGMDRRRMEF